MTFSSVDFPAPLAPTSATSSPRRTVRLTSSMTVRPSYPARTPRSSMTAGSFTGSDDTRAGANTLPLFQRGDDLVDDHAHQADIGIRRLVEQAVRRKIR